VNAGVAKRSVAPSGAALATVSGAPFATVAPVLAAIARATVSAVDPAGAATTSFCAALAPATATISAATSACFIATSLLCGARSVNARIEVAYRRTVANAQRRRPFVGGNTRWTSRWIRAVATVDSRARPPQPAVFAAVSGLARCARNTACEAPAKTLSFDLKRHLNTRCSRF
jgi:hypothetical protein